MTIELIYEATCPNAEGARGLIRRALEELGVKAQVREFDRDAGDAPEYARNCGSPTILVDGKDVDPGAATPNSCRLYLSNEGRLAGTPSYEKVRNAIQAAQKRGGWGILAVIPAMGSGLLPVVTCPACWPLYASALSGLGLGFMGDARVINWVVGALSLVGLLGVGIYALWTRQYLVSGIGIAALAMILAGKVLLGSTPLVYVGIGLSVGAVALARWRNRARSAEVCPSC